MTRFFSRVKNMSTGRIVAGALALSAAGLVAIANFEGFSGEAYTPIPGDKLTIGFGSTAGVSPGDTISVPEALGRLKNDAAEAESAVRECITVGLKQREFDAFVSLAFNIGKRAFCTSTLVRKANAGDFPGACAEILRWHYAQGQSVPGLVARRQAEYRMCMGVD